MTSENDVPAQALNESPPVLSPDEKLASMRAFDGKFVPGVVENDSLLLSLLGTSPVFSSLLKSVDGGVGALDKYAKTMHRLTVRMQTISKGFHIATLAIDLLNFIFIPVAALAAWQVNEKSPFTVSNGTKWAYSAMILALGLTGLLIPGAAPIMAGAGIALALGASVVVFGKLLSDRRKHTREIKRLNAGIAAVGQELDELQQTAANTSLSEEQVEQLYEAFSETKQRMQSLVDTREKHRARLHRKGGEAMLDKGMGMSFMMLAAIAAAITLVFPQVGFTVLACTAALAATYIVGRITVTLLGKLKAALTRPEKPVEDGEAIASEPTILQALHAEPKRDIAQQNQILDQASHGIAHALAEDDPAHLADTLALVAPRFPDMSAEDVDELLNSVPGWSERGEALLARALVDPGVGKASKAILASTPGLHIRINRPSSSALAALDLAPATRRVAPVLIAEDEDSEGEQPHHNQ